jgi:tRNA uridine 5-carbamoylmethylation protein Kti12
MVLVLCGLPGAGKSTLARRLAQSSVTHIDGELQVEVHHISFDDVDIGGVVAASSEVEEVAIDFEADRWRRSRVLALLEVERRIDESRQTNNSVGTCASRRLIVVDDNMYYRSMRHQCYLLAKKRSCPLLLGASTAPLPHPSTTTTTDEVPYGQVYVEVPLAVALARNARRTGPARVPDEIIERMHARFEAPLPADHGWERHTCVVHPEREEEPECDVAADLDLQRLWQAIAAMWSDNFVRACEERERERRRDEDREQCLTNFLHRLDQQLRSRVASILATTADRRSAKEAGKLVAQLKRAFLAEARSRDDVRVFLARPGSAGGVTDVAPTQDPAELQLVRQLVEVFAERCLAVLAPP